MSAHSFETGRRDLCSETSLGGLEPKLNPSRLLCFITTKSRQHATMSHAHLHLYTGLTGRRVEEPIHRPVGRLPKMPPIQTHTYMRAHTCTNPWLSLGPVLDYRIRTLFHYLPTLYRTHTRTHNDTLFWPETTGWRQTQKSIKTDDIYTKENTVALGRRKTSEQYCC